MVQLLKVTLRYEGLIMTRPSGVFKCNSCPYQASGNLSVPVQVFLTWDCFPQKFLFIGFCSSTLRFSVPILLVSNFGSSSQSYDLSFLTDLRRVVKFSVRSGFQSLLEQSGIFQVPNKPDQKLVVCFSISQTKQTNKARQTDLATASRRIGTCEGITCEEILLKFPLKAKKIFKF